MLFYIDQEGSFKRYLMEDCFRDYEEFINYNFSI